MVLLIQFIDLLENRRYIKMLGRHSIQFISQIYKVSHEESMDSAHIPATESCAIFVRVQAIQKKLR